METSESVPLFENDLHEPGVIDASAMHQPQDVPRVAVLCFFNDVLEDLARRGDLRQVYTLRSEIGCNPVYEMTVGSSSLLVMHPGVGAPLAAGFTEELAALGPTTFVAVGGAGALIDDLDLGHVMIVESAVRDEGTSFHYAEPGRIIHADPLGVRTATTTLDQLGVPYIVGRAWTTDALFRETRSRVDRRVAEGCRMVDMEASAFIAVAQYRRLRFAHLLYAGDSLAGDTWDSRHWDSATTIRAQLLTVAAHVTLALHTASPAA